MIPPIPGMKKSLSNSAVFVKERSGSTPHLSCPVHTANRISELISGDSVLSQINEIFSSIIKVEVSLPMTFSCGSSCKHLCCKPFPVDYIIADSKWWTLCLFQQIDLGVYLDQVNSQECLEASIQQMIVVSTTKKCSNCRPK